MARMTKINFLKWVLGDLESHLAWQMRSGGFVPPGFDDPVFYIEMLGKHTVRISVYNTDDFDASGAYEYLGCGNKKEYGWFKDFSFLENNEIDSNVEEIRMLSAKIFTYIEEKMRTITHKCLMHGKTDHMMLQGRGNYACILCAKKVQLARVKKRKVPVIGIKKKDLVIDQEYKEGTILKSMLKELE